MAEQVMKTGDEIEREIGDVLKPFVARPHVYPVAAVEAPHEPVRTLTQFLVDIEAQIGMFEKHMSEVTEELGQRAVSQEKNLATILKAMDERLARIENSIGAR